MKINVNLKSMGKRRGAVKPVTYEIPGHPGTVRELIYAVTRAGVEEYNQRMESPDLLRYLTSEEIDDKAQAGKVSFGVNYGEKKADIAKAQENAVQCFEDGIYRIFLDEEPVEAPTLEWVEFSNRKTFEPLTIEQVLPAIPLLRCVGQSWSLICLCSS